MGIIGNYKNPQIKDADGNMQKSAAEAWSEENGGKDGKATIEQQMKANIKKLKDYKKNELTDKITLIEEEKEVIEK